MKQSSTKKRSKLVKKVMKEQYHKKAMEQDAQIADLTQQLELKDKQIDVHKQELQVTKQELNIHKARAEKQKKAKEKKKKNGSS